jgi:hypothetical protein
VAPTDHLGPRLVCLAGVLVGCWAYVSLATTRPDALGVNYDVYATAGRGLLDGGSLYAATPPDHPTYRFRYPPIVAVAFVPYAFVPFPVGFAVHTLLQVGAGLALAGLTVRLLDRLGVALATIDRLLIAGFLVVGIHAVPSIYYGNVNVPLAAVVGYGVVALDGALDDATDGDPRPAVRRAGLAFGLAALVKVFPAGFGALFVRHRTPRAVVAAVGVGVGGLLAGLALGPTTTAAYLEAALLPRLGVGATASDVNGAVADPSAPYVTARKPFLAAGAGETVAAVAAVVVVAVVVAAVYRDVSTPLGRLRAAFATVAGVVLAVPSYFAYLPFVGLPLLALAYAERGRTRTLVVVGAALTVPAYGLASVLRFVRALGLPPGAEAPAVAALGATLTVASPPGYGLLLALAGCLLATARDRRRTGSDAPGGAGAGATASGDADSSDG